MPQEHLTKKLGLFANILLVAGAIAAALVLLYELLNNKPVSTARMLYLAAPVIAAGLFIGALKLSPAHKLNVILLCLSLGLSAYAIEAYLYVSNPMPYERRTPITWTDGAPQWQKERAKEFAKRFGVDLDTRDRIEVIKELRSKSVDAVPFISPSNNLFIRRSRGPIELDSKFGLKSIVPLSALANKVTVLCNENIEWVVYQSDTYGFNNPASVWKANPVEIAAVGDSFTQGYCVPRGESFVGLIRGRHPATVNLGVAGNGPLLMLATLREYLTSVKPKIVLWFYYEGNDLRDLRDHMNLPLLGRYLESDYTQGLREQQREIDRALSEYISQAEAKPREKDDKSALDRYFERSLKFFKLVGLRERLRLIPVDDRAQLEGVSDANMRLFREILSKAKSEVDAWGGKIYFVYLPTWSRYALRDPGLSGHQRTRVLDDVKSLGIPLIDIHPAFQAHPDPLSLFPFREPGHYNEKGHKIVADEVLKVLPVADLVDHP